MSKVISYKFMESIFELFGRIKDLSYFDCY